MGVKKLVVGENGVVTWGLMGGTGGRPSCSREKWSGGFCFVVKMMVAFKFTNLNSSKDNKKAIASSINVWIICINWINL